MLRLGKQLLAGQARYLIHLSFILDQLIFQFPYFDKFNKSPCPFHSKSHYA